MSPISLNKLVIIGVGLIGGSFALALRKAGAVRYIVGVGRSQQNMQHALSAGIIDEIATSMASALHQADFVLLAMPVGQNDHIMAKIAPHLQAHTIVSDAGSTKQDVITAATNHLGKHLKNFVPGHPIAGAELSGVTAAKPNLYLNKHVILTPLKETTSEAIQMATELWQTCKAKVSLMEPAIHDEILAMTSHLPHILAFALMNHLHHCTQSPQELLRFTGSGFRDFTRIASSSPEMWRDICLSNRKELLKQINVYQSELSVLQFILEKNDGEALEKAFSQARNMREHWLNNES